LGERARAYFRVRFFGSWVIFLAMLIFAWFAPTQGILIVVVCVGLDLAVLFYQNHMTLRGKPLIATWFSLIVAALVSAYGMFIAKGSITLTLGIQILLVLAAALVLFSRKAAYVVGVMCAALYTWLMITVFIPYGFQDLPNTHQSLPDLLANLLLGLLFLFLAMLLSGEAAESLGQWSLNLENEVERKSAALQEALLSQKRTAASLRLLSEVNKLIVRAHNPQRLFDEVCRLLVERGYTYAWIGRLEGTTETLEILAYAGASLQTRSQKLSNAKCARQAIHSRQYVNISVHHETECETCPMFALLPQRAALAMPIQRGARLFGVIVVARVIEISLEIEVSLIEELADDLAYALENLEIETQRRTLAENAASLLTARNETSFWPVVLAMIRPILRADRAAIYLYDHVTDTLSCLHSLGLSSEYEDEINRRFREIPGGLLLHNPQPVAINDTQADPRATSLRPMLQKEGIQAYAVFPLFAAHAILGALVAYRNERQSFTQPDLEAGQTLAHLVAVALQNTRLFTDLGLAYEATLEGWARALELRDKGTEGHTRRVVELAVRLARAMNLSEEQITPLRHGALLHDIGKMAIPDNILHKAGPLTLFEQEIMRQHPQYAYDMLAPIHYLHPALDIPYCHHERWDGTGYPRGLHAEEIPLAARIFSVVDVWDALTSDRPYRPAWDSENALNHLRENAGKQFDPQAVEAFITLIYTDP
jgi:HD-GYP domain-containing protein (c-di-GMP phosphodiesterase class II)